MSEDSIRDLTTENSMVMAAIAPRLGLTLKATSAKISDVRSSANPKLRLAQNTVYAHSEGDFDADCQSHRS